jgi:ATP synthase protein I
MDKNYERSKERRRRLMEEFSKRIGSKASLKIRSRQETDETVWFGLGVFGIVGWSVAIPTLIGVAVGLWIDATWPSRFSWTLMLLIAGVMLGCMNAWYWVRKVGMYRNSGGNGHNEDHKQ